MALAGKSMRLGARKVAASRPSRARVVAPRAAASSDMGFETMRQGIKKASDDTILTPRFYTT
jgi:magnesium-protoporphyrin IX monomethyl ester (oxidative) cyclase